jgi:hypothetical protein
VLKERPTVPALRGTIDDSSTDHPGEDGG